MTSKPSGLLSRSYNKDGTAAAAAVAAKPSSRG